jgi:hypothetical protein
MRSSLAAALVGDPGPEDDAERQHQLEAKAWRERAWQVIRPEDRARMPRLVAMWLEQDARGKFG